VSVDTTEARFWAKVAVRGADECWEWQGARDGRGYGLLAARPGSPQKAHRVAWRLAHGEISGERCVLHRCDNRLCVNVEHLFLGTRGDNARDAQAKGVVRRDALSGVRGVIWDRERSKWQGRVTRHGVTHHLGRFDSVAMAEAAVREKRAELLESER